MQKYQIIPRKFRPKRFDEVAGQEAIVTTLKNAIAQERIGQAYLFCGARGCGKTTLARLFAKALNCVHLSQDHEPCNECTSCLEISEGRNLDIFEIDGASNRGIDDIRQINETVGYAPNKGPYKIYIIDEVHMLTKEAFNALLKTLEEPPKNVKFFFATTEPHKVPQTIISRCQRFNLGRIREKALIEKLKRISTELNVDIEEDALVQISHLCEGSLRDAESLLDQLICFGKSPITLDLTRDVFGLISNQHLFDLDEAIHTQNLEKGLELAQKLYESGKDLGAAIDSLLEHFRTYLLIALGHPAQEAYQKWHYTKDQCLTILDTLMQWQQHMLKTPFKHIHLEMLLLNLVRTFHRIPLDNLVQRLLDLEQRQTQAPIPEAPKQQEETYHNQPQTLNSDSIVESDANLKKVSELEQADQGSKDSDQNAKLEADCGIPTPSKNDIYRNNLKNRDFDEEAPQNFCSERATIAGRQGASEDENYEVKPTKSKTDSSSCFGIHPSKYDTLIRFAAVELEGTVRVGL